MFAPSPAYRSSHTAQAILKSRSVAARQGNRQLSGCLLSILLLTSVATAAAQTNESSRLGTPSDLPAANTNTQIATSAYPYISGSPITYTATVLGNGVPTGTVQFEANGTPLGAAQLLNGLGKAIYTTNSLPAGYLAITAAYTSNNLAFNSSISKVLTEAVYTSPRQTAGVLFTGAVQTLGSGFSLPAGLAVDANDNVFVADAGDRTVKEIFATGGYATVKTVAGAFNTPAGIVLDSNSNIFVTDRIGTLYEIIASQYSQIVDLNRAFSATTGLAIDAKTTSSLPTPATTRSSSCRPKPVAAAATVRPRSLEENL